MDRSKKKILDAFRALVRLDCTYFTYRITFQYQLVAESTINL